mgnify:CR=1 FL=1
MLIGLPLGVLLYLTAPGALLARPRLYATLSLAINLLRSLPFIILLIVMIPLTLQLVGTSLGVAGAIPPLVAAAAPFFARLAENTLREVARALTGWTYPTAPGATASASTPSRPRRRCASVRAVRSGQSLFQGMFDR